MVRTALPHGLEISPGKRTFVLTVFTGITIGFTGTYFLLEHSSYMQALQWNPLWFESVDAPSAVWRSGPHSHADLGPVAEVEGNVPQHSPTEDFHTGEDLVAQQLARQVRVLCWVMTSPANHQSKARHVLATWGRRCNTLLFVTSANDSSLPVVLLDLPEGRNMLWAKTKAAFTYVHQHHADQYDWVLKADDDTYVVVENLRFLLYQYNSSDPLYFGCRFNKFMRQGYMSGGAGYVLSKESVARLVTQAIPDESKCRGDSRGAEDAELGRCLENVGVIAMDSRDQYQRGRFFPFVPGQHLMPNRDPRFWYWDYIYYNTTDGLDGCSDTAITFHYISPQEMYVMDYMIYHLRPYGIQHKDTLHLHHT